MRKRPETPDLPPLSEEFDAAEFGDQRLTRRLGRILDAAAGKPGAGFPEQAASDADLEGTYRFLGNERVKPEKILAPHVASTVRRVAESGLVLAIHDTTEFGFDPETTRDLGWLTRSRRGFLGHFALAVSAEGQRRPFGLLGMATLFRPPFDGPVLEETEKKATKRKRNRATYHQGESRRWSDLALEVGERLAGLAEVLHIMDREGDSYALFADLLGHGQRFVIRLNHDRNVEDEEFEKVLLSTRLNQLDGIIEREVKIARRGSSKRPPKALKERPVRDERLARLNFSAMQATFCRPHGCPSTFPKQLTMNVIRVWEAAPPDGEEPIEWRLITSEPITTTEQVLAIVDYYRTRWVIEEFFKALKTGCAYEKRQLESRHAMLNALAMLAPVAWRLLVLRMLSRTTSDYPATDALTTTQLDILRAICQRLKIKIDLPQTPTIRQAMLAVAELGGHVKYRGDPGWMVLGRGLEKLLIAELGWRAHAEHSKM